MMTKHGICQVAIAPLRAAASDESEIVTQLLFGDYVEILEKGEPWIKVYFPADDYEGWMDFKQLTYISQDFYELQARMDHPVVNTGVLKINGPLGEQHIIMGSNIPMLDGKTFRLGGSNYALIDENPELTESFVETALRYKNTPYLWGGKGIFGIDCSGLTQIVAKVHGINIPRDASQQCEVGQKINFDQREAGDLMFFVNAKGSVHHVGILINEKEIIHAAGHVRIDTYDEKGIYQSDFEKYTHTFHSIKRIWSK